MVVTPYPAGAGSATLSIVEDRDDSEGSIVGHFTRYRLDATPNEGWEFDHFEWDWEFKSKGGQYSPETTETGTKTRIFTPVICGEDFGMGDLVDYYYEITDIDVHDRNTVTACRVYFKQKNGRIIVYVSAVPQKAMESKCEATVDGVSQKTKDGQAGSLETFSLEAKPANGWKFWKWIDNVTKAIVSKEATFTLSLRYNTDGSTISKSYYAVFVNDTGKIIHSRTSGKVLFGNNGRILFEG